MDLRELLKSKGLTQEGLVGKFLDRGHNKYRQQVGDWVNGKRCPDLISITYMAEELGCSTDVVITAILNTMGVKLCSKSLYVK